MKKISHKISHKINQIFWRLLEGILAICGLIGVVGCIFAIVFAVVLICLPIYPELKMDEQLYVIDKIIIIMGSICWCVWFIFR